MNVKRFVIALAVYTILPGVVVVSGVYFLTHSGLYMLIVAGVGLVSIVLGIAGRGEMGAGGPGHVAGNAGVSDMMAEGMSLRPSSDGPALLGTLGDYTMREILILAGFGLMGGAFIALAFFRASLQ